MVNPTVDNKPLSITLSLGESVTVPDDEVWRVNITVGNTRDEFQDSLTELLINGHAVTSIHYDTDRPISVSTGSTGQIVLVGGDTVLLKGDGAGAHIGGFVVN